MICCMLALSLLTLAEDTTAQQSPIAKSAVIQNSVQKVYIRGQVTQATSGSGVMSQAPNVVMVTGTSAVTNSVNYTSVTESGNSTGAKAEGVVLTIGLIVPPQSEATCKLQVSGANYDDNEAGFVNITNRGVYNEAIRLNQSKNGIPWLLNGLASGVSPEMVLFLNNGRLLEHSKQPGNIVLTITYQGNIKF